MPNLLTIAEILGVVLLLAGLVLIPLGLATFSTTLALIVAGVECLALGLLLVGVSNPEFRTRTRGR